MLSTPLTVRAARRVLARCFAEWQSYLSEGFKAIRDNGELAARADPAELALTVMSALQGGLRMAQATRSARPPELASTWHSGTWPGTGGVRGSYQTPGQRHDAPRCPVWLI